MRIGRDFFIGLLVGSLLLGASLFFMNLEKRVKSLEDFRINLTTILQRSQPKPEK